MFGYVVPSYGRLSPADNQLYRRYYCEGCHQLRDHYGLTGTATVNYDMTFNTILLEGLKGDCLDFEGTTRKVCVLEQHKADSELMRQMAAYTLILTKWELYDDETDLPSMKTKTISFVLGNAIRKACNEFPEFDEMVGDGFSNLHKMELDGCRNALHMGREFGRSLAAPLREIAGDLYSAELNDLFVELTASVYLMDAIDDLEQDFVDGTYNPILPESGFINARKYIDSNMFSLAGMVNDTIGTLQSSYAKVRPQMKGNVTLCNNIVNYGIPESAKRTLVGETQAKASVKNILSSRKARLSEGS